MCCSRAAPPSRPDALAGRTRTPIAAPPGATEQAIEDEASRWVVVNTGGDPDADDRRAFDAWYRADPRHARVYSELMQVWHQLSVVDASVIRKRRRSAGRRVAALAIAILALGAAFAQRDEIRVLALSDESTSVGEVRAVRLADGSNVTLDVHSAIRVTMTPERREIRLLRGRAMFDVAHDAARPFVVSTDDAQATALGTRFTVAAYADHSTVAVLESRVALHCIACGATAADRVLMPRDEADVFATGDVVSTRIDVSQAVVQQGGMLTFESVPLTDALARVQGYTRRPIWLLPGADGERRISAVIDPRMPESAVRVLAAAAGLPVRSAPGVLLVGMPKNILSTR